MSTTLPPRTPTRTRRALPAALLLTVLPACEQPAARPVTMISCNATLLTVAQGPDTVLRRVALDTVPALNMVQGGRWDGCPVEAVAFDPVRLVAFLVLPDRASDDGGKRYHIAAVQLPALEVLARFDLVDQLPTRLEFDAARDRVLVGLPEATSLALSSPTLTELQRSPEGLPRDGAARPAAQLSPTQHATAQRRLGADSGSYYAWPVATSDTHVLFTLRLRADSAQRSSVLVLAEAARGGAAATVAYPVFETARGRPTLLADGRHVVVQEVDRPMSGPASAIRVTGRVQFADAVSGRVLGEVRDERLAGPFGLVAPICSSPDGQRLYLRSAGSALGVLVVPTRRFVVLPAAGPVDPSTACLF